MTPKTIRVTKLVLFLLVIPAVALIGGVVLQRLLSGPDVRQEQRKGAQPEYRMQIEGLRFYGMNQGRRVVSITADRFTLRRGKIGFFSTGLTRTAQIENAIINIYAVATAPSSRHAPPSAGEFDFGCLFAEETFSSLFPVRNIAEIEVSPVAVHLHNDKSVLTRIIAAKASVRLKDKEILFTGNVRVSTGSSELTTEHLSFLPGTSRLRTDHPFVLKRGDRTLEGTSLTTDIFLK